LLKKNSLEHKRSVLVVRIRELERSTLPNDMDLLKQLLAEKMELDKQIVSLKR
jgi:hypothetical protein